MPRSKSAVTAATERALMSTYSTAQPGDTERNLVNRLGANILQAGADLPAFLYLTVGPNTGHAHPDPTDYVARADGSLIDSCTGTRYNQFMIRSFRHRGLRRLMSETTPAGWPPTNWTESLSPWQTWMPPASQAISICRDTDCIHSGGTEEDCGAFRLLATGGSLSGLKPTTCTTLISSITTD